MGWSFRKSINRGPFRINASKSGLGFSVGSKGFRAGVRPNGRTYGSYTIPGTGIRYQTGGKGCLGLALAIIGCSAAFTAASLTTAILKAATLTVAFLSAATFTAALPSAAILTAAALTAVNLTTANLPGVPHGP